MPFPWLAGIAFAALLVTLRRMEGRSDRKRWRGNISEGDKEGKKVEETK